MADCRVLRCPIPAAQTFVSPGPDRREAPVCAEHHELIEAGADWRWVTEGILMGEDLKALGEFVVESMNAWRGVGLDSVSPDGFLTLQLKLRRRGTTELEDRVILLSTADAAKWAMGFKVSAGW